MLATMGLPEFAGWIWQYGESPWGLGDSLIASFGRKPAVAATADEMVAPFVAALKAQGCTVEGG